MIQVLTIAGFDGCAGAGILADVKASAFYGVYCQAVCTALTVQNEDEFLTPGWVPWECIEGQLETLFKKHVFEFVKIGLIENAKILKRVVELVRRFSPNAFIVWDPIASATAGFRFLNSTEQEYFLSIMKRIDLVTPNLNEYTFLGLDKVSPSDSRERRDFAVLLKGGHSKGDEAIDVLWTKDCQKYEFVSPRLMGVDKHGTGCSLSSAIVANIALGKSLPDACKIAKDYMDKFLGSGEGRLGFIFDK